MSDHTPICVICGENIILENDTTVVEVLSTVEGPIQRVVHRECIDDIRESLRR